MNKRTFPTELQLLLVVLIWAVNYPIVKYGITGLNIFVFNSIRFIVAGIFIWIFFLGQSRWTPVERRDWKGLLQAGVIAHVLYQIAFIVGLNLTTAGNSAILISTSPLWTIVLHARLHKEKIRSRVWAGIILSLCGVALLIIGSGKKIEFGSNALIGDIICFLAAILWGLNTTLQKPLLSKYSPPQVNLVMIAVGAAGLTLAATPNLIHLYGAEIHWSYYAAALISGMFSIGLANVLWSNGVKRIGPGRTAIFNNLVPVFAFALSYITLHEEVLPIQFIGAAVTISGVWIARR